LKNTPKISFFEELQQLLISYSSIEYRLYKTPFSHIWLFMSFMIILPSWTQSRSVSIQHVKIKWQNFWLFRTCTFCEKAYWLNRTYVRFDFYKMNANTCDSHYCTWSWWKEDPVQGYVKKKFLWNLCWHILSAFSDNKTDQLTYFCLGCSILFCCIEKGTISSQKHY
jgi:hypothetical protein